MLRHHGQESDVILTISDLIKRGCPLTAASSLGPRPAISSSKHHRNSKREHLRRPTLPTCQTLKSLSHPAILVGTLTLPSFADGNPLIKCACFQFSDDSASICCDILDFDLKIVGRKIRILAWNFLPLKGWDKGAKGGFLEIIRWEFFQDVPGACDIEDNPKAGCAVFGVIESMSHVFAVPCSSEPSKSRNISGFLVNVLVCRCKLCTTKIQVSEFKCSNEESVKDHSFIKRVIVYFFGLASSWHPVISKLIDDAILLTGLKKKLVFITKQESQLMFVTTDDVSLHIVMPCWKQGVVQANGVTEKRECVSYTGVVTGVYMQGMVAELDKNVMLLLSDQHLSVPHCMRVGAIVTLKHVKLVDPKFLWGKMLIIGTCCGTTMHVESFSPLETRCHLKSQSSSLLQEFINSLSSAARLWVLLTVNCWRKKFAGILSEKELLGSNNKDGLVHKYASLHLPPSAFQFRNELLVEFCKPDLSFGDEEAHCSHLRLVPPIANLISHSEASWKSILDDWEKLSNSTGSIDHEKILCCGERSYTQSVRRVLHAEEIGVSVMGTLRTSVSSGRLQLVDATGEIDVVLDLPNFWLPSKIYEAKEFKLIMEGMPQKLVDLNLTLDRPLSCRNIFSNALLEKPKERSVHLYCYPTREDSRSRSIFFDWRENSRKLDHGKFHLLMLTHKFPVQQKFQGDLAKMSRFYAEAIVLPWGLLVSSKSDYSVGSSEHWRDSSIKFAKREDCPILKRCKIEQDLVETSSCSLNDTENRSSGNVNARSSSSWNKHSSCVSNHQLELPCLIVQKGIEDSYRLGFFSCTKGHAKIASGCKKPCRKVLLEFGADTVSMYEMLRIGRYYLVRHEDNDVPCPIKENIQVSRPKVFTSENHIWSCTFSSIEGCKNSNVSGPFQTCKSHASSLENMTHRKFVNTSPTSIDLDSEILSDIKILVPSTSLNLLDDVNEILNGHATEARGSFNKESVISDPTPFNSSMQASGVLSSGCHLPEGDLVTFQGLIIAFHHCCDDALPAQHRQIPCEGFLRTFIRGKSSFCVHVLVDKTIVKIVCDMRKQTYPAGFGRDVRATFHRVLELGDQNDYMMTPASFIAIEDKSLTNAHLSDDFEYACEPVRLTKTESPNSISSVLISDAVQLSELKTVQICCRVLDVFVLVMEIAKTTKVFPSSTNSPPSPVRIPLACFLVDDGSSTCCCWADSERATTLLRLDCRDDSAKRFRRSKADKRQPCSSTISQLKKILKRHERVVVKNYESFSDSTCQGLMFSVASDSSINSLDEDLLMSLITRAFLSTTWTIVGSFLDPKTANMLEEQLADIDMALPPVMNIWATSVSHTDMLSEARNIMRQLL